jgi:hypothetical protein
MVHYLTPNGQQFLSYYCQNLARLLNWEFWIDLTFRHKLVSWRNFFMTTLKTLNTEIVANYLSFLLVIHMFSSDGQFYSYEFSKTGYGAELFWTDWIEEWNLRFKGPRWVKLGEVWSWILQLTFLAFQRLLVHDFGNHSNGYGSTKSALMRS